MPVPSTQEIRKPLLETFKDEAPHSFVINDFLEMMADKFDKITTEMSSTEKTTFKNNINEAKTFLYKQGLLSHPSKSTYMITTTGIEVLEENPEVIDEIYLAGRNNASEPEPISLPPVTPVTEEPEQSQQEEFEAVPEIEEAEDVQEVVSEEPEEPEEVEEVEEIQEAPEDFVEEEFENAEEEIVEPEPEQQEEIAEPVEEVEPAPTEPEPEPEAEEEIVEVDEDEYEEDEFMQSQNIEDVFKKYNADLTDEVLEKVAAIPSDRFEMLVIDLLSKMGYRAFQNARYTSETEGSDLIHGVILENKAGMTPIYIQARKLSPSKTVGRSDMQDFIEAITDKGGKGLFATTSNFSEQAVIAANDERVMLIDGKRLASLMIANNFCVNVERVFEVKSIDLDSFSEYEN